MPAETHSHHAPIAGDEATRLVIERIGEILERDPDAINIDADLRADLDADDLAILELVESLEEELGERTVGFHIDDDDLVELRTPRDIVDCVLGALGGASAASGGGERAATPESHNAKLGGPGALGGASAASGGGERAATPESHNAKLGGPS